MQYNPCSTVDAVHLDTWTLGLTTPTVPLNTQNCYGCCYVIVSKERKNECIEEEEEEKKKGEVTK